MESHLNILPSYLLHRHHHHHHLPPPSPSTDNHDQQELKQLFHSLVKHITTNPRRQTRKFATKPRKITSRKQSTSQSTTSQPDMKTLQQLENTLLHYNEFNQKATDGPINIGNRSVSQKTFQGALKALTIQKLTHHSSSDSSKSCQRHCQHHDGTKRRHDTLHQTIPTLQTSHPQDTSKENYKIFHTTTTNRKWRTHHQF